MSIKPKKGAFSLPLGERGEMIAAAYLTEKGYKLLDKKIRASFGELDLVAQTQETLIFVEVKTRSSEKFGLPEEAVAEHKKKQMIRLAEWYFQKKRLENLKMRFDVISILYDGVKEPQIRHIQNAFEAV